MLQVIPEDSPRQHIFAGEAGIREETDPVLRTIPGMRKQEGEIDLSRQVEGMPHESFGQSAAIRWIRGNVARQFPILEKIIIGIHRRAIKGAYRPGLNGIERLPYPSRRDVGVARYPGIFAVTLCHHSLAANAAHCAF